MQKVFLQLLKSGIVTNSFPQKVLEPPAGFRGKPIIDFSQCTACDRCSAACPTTAISVITGTDKNNIPADERIMSLNYGDCIFCGECEAACPDVIHLSKEFQLAATSKSDLTTRARYKVNQEGVFAFAEILSEKTSSKKRVEDLGKELKETIAKRFGRSLHIREVDAGSCNGCEMEITALNNPVYDIERFGIHFVASPRHADMLIVTGPVTRAMEIALRQTYEATPNPKLVVAVGACAIGGGIFGESYTSCGGVDRVVPVDVFIPGCPPRPEALLHGILLAINQMPQKIGEETEYQPPKPGA